MTKGIIILTLIVSVASFYQQSIHDKLVFNPYLVYHRNEWYRLFTHGFIHADWMHLIINMFVLFSFGPSVEYRLRLMEQDGSIKNPSVIFALLYGGGIVISSLNTLRKHRDHSWYNSLGASGAVSAVVFTGIFFEPMRKIYLYGLLGLPGILMGILYLAYSWYMGKKDRDNINHDAHFIGAVYGMIFPALFDIQLIPAFIHQIF
ncbi:MAG: rhomboid family intramembrane serine protease [Bacteroidia bacterium]|nr:rhomboid family intramembrane serine protease [Bacteroidia bacterium]